MHAVAVVRCKGLRGKSIFLVAKDLLWNARKNFAHSLLHTRKSPECFLESYGEQARATELVVGHVLGAEHELKRVAHVMLARAVRFPLLLRGQRRSATDVGLVALEDSRRAGVCLAEPELPSGYLRAAGNLGE